MSPLCPFRIHWYTMYNKNEWYGPSAWKREQTRAHAYIDAEPHNIQINDAFQLGLNLIISLNICNKYTHTQCVYAINRKRFFARSLIVSNMNWWWPDYQLNWPVARKYQLTTRKLYASFRLKTEIRARAIQERWWFRVGSAWFKLQNAIVIVRCVMTIGIDRIYRPPNIEHGMDVF